MKFQTEDFEVFSNMIYAAISRGLQFTSSYEDHTYTIEYTGGF